MNRAIFFAVFLLVAGACSDTPTNISSPDVPDPSFASKSKWTLLHAQKIEFSNSQLWPCVNEVVDFSGWFNVTVGWWFRNRAIRLFVSTSRARRSRGLDRQAAIVMCRPRSPT